MTLTPADVAMVRWRIEDMDEDGAAEALANALGLSDEARRLLSDALFEARTGGYCEGYADAKGGKPNKVEFWGGVRP